jgi:hypothetical protein
MCAALLTPGVSPIAVKNKLLLLLNNVYKLTTTNMATMQGLGLQNCCIYAEQHGIVSGH